MTDVRTHCDCGAELVQSTSFTITLGDCPSCGKTFVVDREASSKFMEEAIKVAMTPVK